MQKALIIVFLLLSVSANSQPLMTLEDAIKLGLKNNFDIKIARNEAEIANYNRGYGTAGFLPTLDANAGISRSNADQEINLPPAQTSSVVDIRNAEMALNWTLFDGFKMFTNHKRYNELAAWGEYRARNQIENSILSISRAYFDLVRQELFFQIAVETNKISKTRLDREKVRQELGGVSSTDFLYAQVAYNNDQATLLDQQLQVKIARQDLNILLGQDPGAEFEVDPDITVPDLNHDYSRIAELALAYNSNLKTAELGQKIADLDVRNARSAFMPRVSAFARYGYSDRTVNSDGGEFPGLDFRTKTDDAVIGLSLSWNLFNGRQDKIALDNARIEAVNQSLTLRDVRNRLIALVRETYETYRQRLEIVSLEEENIKAARQNLDLQNERLKLGTANSLEFRDAQVSLAQARSALVTARYQARISRLELDYLIGELISD
jgi:outer membrane protein TolC